MKIKLSKKGGKDEDRRGKTISKEELVKLTIGSAEKREIFENLEGGINVHVKDVPKSKAPESNRVAVKDGRKWYVILGLQGKRHIK